MKTPVQFYVAPDEFETTYDHDLALTQAAVQGDLMLPPTQLLATEASALKQHEAVIARGIQTFIEVGEALQHIRDERLYRATHDTFEAYCRER